MLELPGGESASARLKRQVQAPHQTGDCPIVAAELDNLKYLSVGVVRPQHAKFRLVETRPVLKRIGGGDQRLFGRSPARRVRRSMHRRRNLIRREFRPFSEQGNMDTPLIFASSEGAGTINQYLACTKAEWAWIQEAASQELAPSPLACRKRPKKEQRR